MNELCSHYEQSFAGEWEFGCYYERGLSHHTCLFYDSERSLLDFLVPYFTQGLNKGAYCFAAQSPRMREGLLRRLRASGLRAERALRTGSLEIYSLNETYFRGEGFDPLAMMTTIEQAIDKSRAARFSGLRSAGDLSWALKDRKLWGQALRYESLLNQLIPGKTVTTVCHYNASLCSPMEAAGLMNVHTSHFHLSN